MNFPKRMSTIVVAALVASVGVITVASDAGARRVEGFSGAKIIVSPTTLQPGDSFTIQNDPAWPCDESEVSGDTGGMTPGAWFTTVDGAGNWSKTLQVPTEGPPDASGNPTPFPPGEYEIHAFCSEPLMAGDGDVGPAAFPYDPVTVTVIAPSPPEPPTPAIEPITAAPTFTG